MNRIVSENLREVTPQRLPPADRQGPARVLFIHINLLGFKTHARNIKHYTAGRDDIDATHIDLVRPMWIKVLNKQVKRGRQWDLRHFRAALLWRPVIKRWLTGPLHLSHFDVVHFLTAPYGWGMAKLWQEGKTGSTRMAVNLDCDAAQYHRDFGWSWFGQRPVFNLEKQIFDASDRIFAFSDWVSRSVREDYQVPEQKIRLTAGSLRLGDHPVAALANRSSRPVKMMFIGNDWLRKGGPLLVDLHQRHFRDTVELHVISAEMDPGPPGQNIIWHGRVPYERIVGELLPDMDLFVMPTDCDMSPWVVLEAAAAGLPVVATRIGAIPEMVIDQQTGLLCTQGDAAAFREAIAQLVSDQQRRVTMGAAARAHIERHFNADVHYNRLIDELVALAGQPPTSH